MPRSLSAAMRSKLPGVLSIVLPPPGKLCPPALYIPTLQAHGDPLRLMHSLKAMGVIGIIPKQTEKYKKMGQVAEDGHLRQPAPSFCTSPLLHSLINFPLRLTHLFLGSTTGLTRPSLGLHFRIASDFSCLRLYLASSLIHFSLHDIF